MTDEQLAAALALLESAQNLDPASPAFLALERAVAHLTKSAKKKRRRARSRASMAADAALSRTAGLSRQRLDQAAPAAEGQRTLLRERACYVCKRPYRELHHWYPQLCPDCGAKSEVLRDLPLDLRGRRALITGGRIKIGYATALRLLRAGAEVHVTTRFPREAARRYGAEPDVGVWSSRLHVHGLDLRDLGRLLGALEQWRAGPPFDVLINNAAQSVWHPPAYFEALHAGERQVLEGRVQTEPAPHPLPAPLVDARLEQLDLKREDSWVQTLGEIAPIEMVEAQVVNAIAPFLICNLLRDNLKRSTFEDRFVINVTAVEGQFERPAKSPRHPHTNMAKAALNMLTRTSAADLLSDRIHMVSVDPGWMSKEGRSVDPDFQPPIDVEDSAGRVVHPLALGLAGRPLSGVLLKDFVQVPW